MRKSKKRIIYSARFIHYATQLAKIGRCTFIAVVEIVNSEHAIIVGTISELDCLRDLFDDILLREFSCWEEFEKWSSDILQQQLLQPLKVLLNVYKEIEYPLIQQLCSGKDNNNKNNNNNHNNNNDNNENDRHNTQGKDTQSKLIPSTTHRSSSPRPPTTRLSTGLHRLVLNYLSCTNNNYSRLTRDVSVSVTEHLLYPSLLFLKSHKDDVVWNCCTNVVCNGILLHKVEGSLTF